MICKTLKIAEFSDVHVLHPNTPTDFILKNLNKAFPNNVETGKLDLIIIAGDFFDRLANLPAPAVIEIELWINRFLRLCKKYDIVLRVLEGTPSHDWKQSNLFERVNDIAEIGADLKYVDTLSIEYIEKFGINVLYVPDEWEPEPDDTWKQVQQLLKDHGLEKVDFSVMHGAFDYQLPSHVGVPTHLPERYLSITKHLIFIGHIHKYSVYDRIISSGSFDRLTHGEEEPKGHIRATVFNDGKYEVKFIENEHAKIYKTFKCTGMPVDESLKYLTNEVAKLPKDSFVRIVSSKTDPLMTSIDLLRNTFPTISFSTKTDKETEVSAQTIIDLRATYQPIHITSGNIKKLLLDRLIAKGYDSKSLKKAEELIDVSI